MHACIGQGAYGEVWLAKDILGNYHAVKIVYERNAQTGRDVSFLGTEGFIAPEGPGTPRADVYSLGKLLFEAAMGRDRKDYPNYPTNFDQRSHQAMLNGLRKAIDWACQEQPDLRYQTAQALHDDLRKLLGGKSR